MYLFSASQGHGDVGLARFERRADRVEAGDELALGPEHVEGPLAHAGHDPHRDDHIGRVGELHTDVGLVRPERAHGERDDIHRPTAHRAVEEPAEHLAHLGRLPPVVCRAGVDLLGRADVGPVLDSGDVSGVGAGPVARRSLGLGQGGEGSLVHEEAAQPLALLGRPVAPFDLIRPRQLCDLAHPVDQLLVGGRGAGARRHPGHTSFDNSTTGVEDGARTSVWADNARHGRWSTPNSHPERVTVHQPAKMPSSSVSESCSWDRLGPTATWGDVERRRRRGGHRSVARRPGPAAVHDGRRRGRGPRRSLPLWAPGRRMEGSHDGHQRHRCDGRRAGTRRRHPLRAARNRRRRDRRGDRRGGSPVAVPRGGRRPDRRQPAHGVGVGHRNPGGGRPAGVPERRRSR